MRVNRKLSSILLLMRIINIVFELILRCKRQENLYERGSLSFISNEDQLAKNIQQFGRVINTSLHLHSDGSERSWEFAGSEVMSYASEVLTFSVLQ